MDNKLVARLDKIQKDILDKKVAKVSAENIVMEIEKELEMLEIKPEELDKVVEEKTKELKKIGEELEEKIKETEEILNIGG